MEEKTFNDIEGVTIIDSEKLVEESTTTTTTTTTSTETKSPEINNICENYNKLSPEHKSEFLQSISADDIFLETIVHGVRQILAQPSFDFGGIHYEISHYERIGRYLHKIDTSNQQIINKI